MRPFMLTLAAAVLALAAPLAASAADYTLEPEVAVAAKGGWWEADVDGFSGGPAYGLELSATDPWAEMPAGKLRHMLSWNHVDQDGLELNTAEWNLHWMFETGSGVWLGLGPGLGYLWSDGDARDDGLAAQFGVSAYTIHGHVLFGIESRYQWTEADNADNWLTMAKIGYVF